MLYLHNKDKSNKTMKKYLSAIAALLLICSCDTETPEPTTVDVVVPETEWVDQDLNGNETGTSSMNGNDSGDID